MNDDTQRMGIETSPDIQHVRADLDEEKHRDTIFGRFKGLKEETEDQLGGGGGVNEINRQDTVNHSSITKLEGTGGNTLLARNIAE